MLYKLRAGACDRSFGVHVARTAGMPRELTDEAERYLAQLQGGEGVTEAWEDGAAPRRAAGMEEEEEEEQ